MSDDSGAKTPVAAASIRDPALRFNAIARKVTHGAFERRDIQNKPLHRIWRKLEIACRKRNRDLPRNHQETDHVFRSTSGCNCWSAPPKDQINHMCHTCVFICLVVERFFFNFPGFVFFPPGSVLGSFSVFETKLKNNSFRAQLDR